MNIQSPSQPDGESKPTSDARLTGGPGRGGRTGYRDPVSGVVASTQPGQPPLTLSSFRHVELLSSLTLIGRRNYLPWKQYLDVLLGLFVSLVMLPVILFTALMVRVTSPGPVLYSQTRLGRFGLPFRIVKFRSMRHNCENKSGAVWATRNDSRVTPIGKFLRITHLDELPQLINLLRGEMSLVGPRPERPEFIPALEQTIPHYRLRMLIKPGITGLAQVYLPPDTDVSSVKKKVQYDLYYIRHISFWLDIKLIVATPLQAMGFPCRFVQWALRLPKPSIIEAELLVPENFGLAPAEKTVASPLLPPSAPAILTQPQIGKENTSTATSEPYIISDSKFGTGVTV